MKNLEKGDWVLVRRGVFCEEPLLLKVLGYGDDVTAYAVKDLIGKFNEGRWFWMETIVSDTGYAVKVPKSSNIEMLELLYLPKRGLLDEETQN